MGNAISALIAVAIILTAVLLIGHAGFASVDATSAAWKDMGQNTSDINRTAIDAYDQNWVSSGNYIDIYLRNTGNVALTNFAQWDVVVTYTATNHNLYILWVPYTTIYPPGNNQWTVRGIYRDATSSPEVFQPGMFNPGEEMVIRIKLSPTPHDNDYYDEYWNTATIGTDKGVTAFIMWEND